MHFRAAIRGGRHRARHWPQSRKLGQASSACAVPLGTGCTLRFFCGKQRACSRDRSPAARWHIGRNPWRARPLVLADVMRGTGHYNLAQGVVGAAVGIGASLSTAVAGYISDHVGSSGTFLFMAGAAATGLLLVIALMPETKGSPSSR